MLTASSEPCIGTDRQVASGFREKSRFLRGPTRPIARLERQGAAESASTPKSGCAMPSHTAILPSIGLLLGAIWEMSAKHSRFGKNNQLCGENS
jgi:hypothetical protein